MQKYFTILTDKGLELTAAAVLNGGKIDITHIVYGDGGGEYVAPYPAQTTLINKVGQVTVKSVSLKTGDNNIIEVTADLPFDRGGFVIRELGIMDSTGNLVAVGNCPDIDKASLTDGASVELTLIFDVAVTNPDTVEIKINPDTFNVTKEEFKAHINNSDVHFTPQEKQDFKKLHNYDDRALKNEVKQKANSRKSYTLLIPAVGWSDIAPYTQRIDVQGMVSDGLPLYDLIEFSEQSMEDYAKLTKLETFENAVEVTANFEKPVGNIKIRIEVVY